jgi:hypothetical protein
MSWCEQTAGLGCRPKRAPVPADQFPAAARDQHSAVPGTIAERITPTSTVARKALDRRPHRGDNAGRRRADDGR